MQQLSHGIFFGHTDRTLHLDGVTITDTEYTHAWVDWHYHEHAYYTFILAGKVQERNKKEEYRCTRGSLLFHHWQEAHCNTKPSGYTRGLQVELHPHWLQQYGTAYRDLQGSLQLQHPDARLHFYRIFRESLICDAASETEIHRLLLSVPGCAAEPRQQGPTPSWVARARELMHDCCTESISLNALSAILGVHPVHLSRSFVRYFGCGFSTYMRKARVAKALSLMYSTELSLTAIAFCCGFADQSHFIRCFKAFTGQLPSAFRPGRC